MSQKRIIAFFVLGILLGATSLSVLHARELDNLYHEVSSLKLHNDELELENVHLSTQLQHPEGGTIVKDIEVDCSTPDNNRTISLAASTHIKQELSFLIGKEMDILLRQPDLPARILDGQTFHAEGKKFTLHVTLIVVFSESLYIQVNVSPV